jgi:Ca2+-binding EF-hand superfamily protein
MLSPARKRQAARNRTKASPFLNPNKHGITRIEKQIHGAVSIRFGKCSYVHRFINGSLRASKLQQALGFGVDQVLHVRLLGVSLVGANHRVKGACDPLFYRGQISNSLLREGAVYALKVTDIRESYVKKITRADRAEIEARFQSIDRDNDGVITVQEIRKYYKLASHARTKRIRSMYKNDPTTMMKKLTAVHQVTADLIRMVEEADADKSGQIELIEFLTTESYAMCKIREQENKKGGGSSGGAASSPRMMMQRGIMSRLNSNDSSSSGSSPKHRKSGSGGGSSSRHHSYTSRFQQQKQPSLSSSQHNDGMPSVDELKHTNGNNDPASLVHSPMRNHRTLRQQQQQRQRRGQQQQQQQQQQRRKPTSSMFP